MRQSSLYNLLKNSNFSHNLIVSENLKEQKLYENVALYFGYDVHSLPDFRAQEGEDLRSYRGEQFGTYSALGSYFRSQKSKKLLLSPIRTALLHLPKKELLERSYTISFGDKISLNSLKSMLYNWGYSFVDIIELEGEVSIRGDILDIFPIDRKNPIRISIFGDEIESIREFSLYSQLSSKDEIESINLTPAFFGLESREELDSAIERFSGDLFFKDICSCGLWNLKDRVCYLDILDPIYSLDATSALLEIFELSKNSYDKNIVLNSKKIEPIDGYKDIIPKDLHTLISLHQDKKITILSRNEALLKQHNLDNQSSNRDKLKFNTKTSPLIINIVTKDELIISLNSEIKKERRESSIILDELKAHDYIVHEEYGVGIYRGIEQALVLGALRDFVSIAYQGDDKLLIPVENLELIDRYIYQSGQVPALDRLGKGSFAKLKERVRERLFEIASEIIKVAAKRELLLGVKLDIPKHELLSFQKLSGFEYTNDQIRSIDEIVDDLKSGKVMDRLLSGDVGFGKTEVAMNAIYCAYKSGYQSMLLTPTTILSNQHYQSLKSRFLDLGIKVAMVNRFVDTKTKNQVLEGLKSGKIDVVVGTHTLLNATFHKLALVVVDEEHKFGVKQKERIKNLSSNLHLLSMSATPIPRTLNMALSSIKGMSTITTPPKERLDVRTFVKEYSNELIKEIVSRELRRGGQIFYIHNNISSIEKRRDEIKKLYSSLDIAILHSKVDSKESEEIMYDFENGKYHMLLSTSIIESGIHLPNANTIVIESSDRFGIADLHQLRGRVGRGAKEGFCYFLVDDKEMLGDEAKKRLLSLENNSFLGSGAVLAYHDLEIRGGGNLVGEAQSGHIKNIGYSLYLRMLEDSINELSGKEGAKKREVDIKLPVSGFISSELVQTDRVRLELYRRLSACEEVYSVYKIEEEMSDRFGTLDKETKQFLSLIIIKILAIKKEIKSVMGYGQNITFIYEDGAKKSISSKSKDDDDILDATLRFLRK